MPSTCCSNARHNYEAVDSNYVVILSIQKSMETRLRFQIPKSINSSIVNVVGFFQIQVILGNEKICASVSISLLCCSEILLACYMLLQNALAVYVHCSVFCKKIFPVIFLCAESGNISYFTLQPQLESCEFLFFCLHCVFHLITEMEIFQQLNWRKKVCKADVVSSSG